MIFILQSCQVLYQNTLVVAFLPSTASFHFSNPKSLPFFLVSFSLSSLGVSLLLQFVNEMLSEGDLLPHLEPAFTRLC